MNEDRTFQDDEESLSRSLSSSIVSYPSGHTVHSFSYPLTMNQSHHRQFIEFMPSPLLLLSTLPGNLENKPWVSIQHLLSFQRTNDTSSLKFHHWTLREQLPHRVVFRLPTLRAVCSFSLRKWSYTRWSQLIFSRLTLFNVHWEDERASGESDGSARKRG